ncbi:RNA polymerase sigma-70 factor (sigma-E family) [Kineococcus radiotolerans]|uniref:RNA polymerase sigma-70 factor (Sigma-E family) n=1 Tax=Kineococcus radiotolerans TaxID=131568 RepID=A0A7W4XYQ5_KINRA|nr:SigE family RNA polymerase sigma factor [Kineococcus radiotolerans]MBB2903303.1 RNA polymerase sigma-70 factor (sigma-E family) [Kineococcus radiotolerans]
MQKLGQDSQQGPDPTSRAQPTPRGDRDFEDWALAHADQLMRTAVFLTGDHHLAEDLLQDTLERTYLHWRRVQEPAAYARTVMARAVTDRWRRRGRRPREVTLDGLWPEQGSGHDIAAPGSNRRTSHDISHDTAERYAEQDEAVTALRQLSPRQRAVLVLRYYEDWTEAQIADVLNCSTGTVKTQASRGLSRLRQLLDTSRVDPPGAEPPRVDPPRAGAAQGARTRSSAATAPPSVTAAAAAPDVTPSAATPPDLPVPGTHPVPSHEERTR